MSGMNPAPMSWTYTASGVITSTPFYTQCMTNIASGSSKLWAFLRRLK